jgi:hypothetical protein
MSDSIRAYREMQEENKISLQADEAMAAAGMGKKIKTAKYIWVLDFGTGEVSLYDISPLCNDLNKWNPDSESCEAFLIGAGHYLKNCEWMVADSSNVNTRE